ncbi:FAAR026Wp [Eremothecium gossypii FDAG1]|nr:FAAR026Wp [Eremothecium gossypii FDAG1]
MDSNLRLPSISHILTQIPSEQAAGDGDGCAPAPRRRSGEEQRRPLPPPGLQRAPEERAPKVLPAGPQSFSQCGAYRSAQVFPMVARSPGFAAPSVAYTAAEPLRTGEYCAGTYAVHGEYTVPVSPLTPPSTASSSAALPPLAVLPQPASLHSAVLPPHTPLPHAPRALPPAAAHARAPPPGLPPPLAAAQAAGTGSDREPDDDAELRCTCGQKYKHRKSQRQCHIPRPRNAFILFRQHWHQQLFPQERIKQSERGNGSFKTNSQVSVDIGQRWRSLSPEERQKWLDFAKREKEEHMRKYPNYKYVPTRKDKKVLIQGEGRNLASDPKSICRACARK